MIQKNIGEMIAILCKSKDITQTKLAEKLNVPLSHINPYFCGHKDVRASTLIALLKEVGINIEQQLKEKLQLENNIEQKEFKTPSDAVSFLFGKMDQLNQETCINHMLFSVKAQGNIQVDPFIEKQIKNQVTMI